MIVYRVPSTCVGSIGFRAGPRLMLTLITVKMKPTATAVTTNSRAPGWGTRIRPKLTARTTAAIAAAPLAPADGRSPHAQCPPSDGASTTRPQKASDRQGASHCRGKPEGRGAGGARSLTDEVGPAPG